MNDRVFIDTNVFVYVDDAAAGAKREQARSVLSPLIRARRAVVSTQVMQEYFSAATRKLKLPPERARWRIEVMSRLDVVVIRPELILGAIDLHRLHALSLWDALIIKCASAAGCVTLLTEDLNHGQTIDGVRIENPFLPATRSGESKVRYQVGPYRTTHTASREAPSGGRVETRTSKAKQHKRQERPGNQPPKVRP